jgi:hypothetical protein
MSERPGDAHSQSAMLSHLPESMKQSDSEAQASATARPAPVEEVAALSETEQLAQPPRAASPS